MPGSITVTVCASELVAPEVRRLTLERLDRKPLPAVAPGDHIRLFRGSESAVPVSVAGQPAASRYQILVADKGDSNSAGAGRTPRLDETLWLDGPGNGMPLTGQPDSVRLIGAGLGLAPLLPLAQALSTTDCRVRLCWIGRGIACSPLRAELAAEFRHRARFHDTAQEGRPDLRTVIGRPEAGGHLYCAGPVAFIEALLLAAVQLGWSAEALHWDRYLPVQTPAGLQQASVTDSSTGLTAAGPTRRF